MFPCFRRTLTLIINSLRLDHLGKLLRMGESMTLLIAVWGAIGFSLIATLVADNKMEEKARLRGVALNLDDRFKN